MLSVRSLLSFALAIAMSAAPLAGQTNDEAYAYSDSSSLASWTAIVPITILIAAGIFFAVADQDHCSDHESDSQDGLGSMAARNSRSSYSSSRSSRSSYSSSRSGYHAH